MKKILKPRNVLIWGLVFIASLFLFSAALAQLSDQTVGAGLNITADRAGITKTQGTADVIATRIGQAINYLFGVLAVIFLSVVLIGGYKWMIAGGNEENVGQAKKWIMNGINGMIVIFLAYALVYVVLLALKGATANGS